MTRDGASSLGPGEGRSYRRMGCITMTFKSDDKGAGYGACETVNHPGGVGASPHRHATYHETHIVVVEGEYEIPVGDEIFQIGRAA